MDYEQRSETDGGGVREQPMSIDYGAIIARVQARTSTTLAWLLELGERASVIAEELSALHGKRARRRRVRELARVEPWAVAASLLGIASRLRRREPFVAAALAELALVAAEEVSHDARSSKTELLGRAQALLGEALSQTNRLQEAKEAFARSAACLADLTTATPLSVYCRLLSRVRRMHGSLGGALALFDYAGSTLGARPTGCNTDRCRRSACRATG